MDDRFGPPASGSKDPISTARLAERLVKSRAVQYEIAFIALAAVNRADALQRLETFSEGKFHDQATADLARAETELREGLEAWRQKGWTTPAPADGLGTERGVRSKNELAQLVRRWLLTLEQEHERASHTDRDEVISDKSCHVCAGIDAIWAALRATKDQM